MISPLPIPAPLAQAGLGGESLECQALRKSLAGAQETTHTLPACANRVLISAESHTYFVLLV